MSIKETIIVMIHISIIFLLIIIMYTSSVFILSYYSPIDTLGDKRISVLYFVIGLSLFVISISYIPRRLIHYSANIFYRYLEIVEISIPLICAISSLIITLLNLDQL